MGFDAVTRGLHPGLYDVAAARLGNGEDGRVLMQLPGVCTPGSMMSPLRG